MPLVIEPERTGNAVIDLSSVTPAKFAYSIDRLFCAGALLAGMVEQSLNIGDTVTIDNLDQIATTTRRKIEECLRAIRQGGRSLALLASAAEVAIHENDHDAAGDLQSVYAAVQSINEAAEAIQRELNQCS